MKNLILKPFLILTFLFFVSFFWSCNNSNVNNPVNSSSYWIKAIGGANNEQTTSMQITNDGGSIISGYTISSSFGDNDMFAVKFDGSGNMSWSNAYGSTANDEATTIMQTTDGGYLLAGQTKSFGAINFDVYVTKLSSIGDITWSKIYKASGDDEVTGAIQTGDGGYIISGYSTSFSTGGDNDVFALKLNSNGSIAWAKAYGGTYNDYAYSLKNTSNGFILAGSTYNFGAVSEDIFIMNLQISGDLTWAKIYGGDAVDIAYCIEPSGTDFMVAGYTTSYGLTTGDILVFKIDYNGFVYSGANGPPRTFGDSYSLADRANSIIPTSDGGYIITGYFTNENNIQNTIILKLYGNLDFNWAKSYGEQQNNAGYCIKQKGSGYFIAGNTNTTGSGGSDVSFISLKSDGSTCQSITDYTPLGGGPTINPIAVTPTIRDVTFQQTDVTTQKASSGFSMITTCSGN